MLSQSPVCPVLPAKDLNRARQFYTEKLGLKETASNDPGGTMFEAGEGSKIYMYERPPVTVEHTQASFLVKDLAAEMAELRGRGVKFEEYDMPGLKTNDGVVEMDGFKSAWFKDSEDNILVLNQTTK